MQKQEYEKPLPDGSFLEKSNITRQMEIDAELGNQGSGGVCGSTGGNQKPSMPDSGPVTKSRKGDHNMEYNIRVYNRNEQEKENQ